ncbi:basic 7S globulin-like [Cynara cardunculus var. scolymus]|uniref:Aspartic peptidase n=1 Tax=Cynara cardunculus var. scolymus TaxID=59895 RepID=A0A103Y355_CYNCS|nr:basic 7S globulin-like [Cynara cardunculus var. scolymus]KVI01654.1 Aspartic peptidase [Cynara cardunculus var. scolymus]
MAEPSSYSLLFFCSFLLVVSSSVAKTSPRPKVLLLSVSKDAETLQYVTQVSQRTPLLPVKLTLDLGGDYMWVNCERGYTSSTYLPAPCGSAPCRLLNTTSCTTECYSAPAPDCYNNTCGHGPTNTVANTGTSGQLGADVFKIQSTDGKNVLPVVTVPRLYFICGSNFIEAGLASGVTGMAGLGRTGASLPAQLSSYFRFKRKFAVCLSSSTRSRGVVFFGNGPYTFLPNVDASSSVTYTPLIINPVTENGFLGDASPKYFIRVNSIKINDNRVLLNETLLSIDSEGYGGTTISTVDPYTILESSIYSAVVDAFVKAMPKNVKRVPSVAPFGACFSSKNIRRTRVGPAVPSIELVLQSESVYWRIYGANSMVEAREDVLCLGFVEAQTDFRPRFAVVIGGHQIEDNLLQFDLSRSRLGFSSSLLGRSTTCANFNFTSTA